MALDGQDLEDAIKFNKRRGVSVAIETEGEMFFRDPAKLLLIDRSMIKVLVVQGNLELSRSLLKKAAIYTKESDGKYRRVEEENRVSVGAEISRERRAFQKKSDIKKQAFNEFKSHGEDSVKDESIYENLEKKAVLGQTYPILQGTVELGVESIPEESKLEFEDLNGSVRAVGVITQEFPEITKNFNTTQRMGDLSFRAKNYSEALKYYIQCLHMIPPNLSCWDNVEYAFKQDSVNQTKAGWFAKLQKIVVDDIPLWFKKANLAVETELPFKELDCYEAIIKLDSENNRAWLRAQKVLREYATR